MILLFYLAFIIAREEVKYNDGTITEYSSFEP
jgi:hypothetical protein